MEGFCCNQTIPIAFDINFTSLLNSVGDMGRIDRVGPQHFGAGKKKMAGVEIFVRVKHDFINFCCDFMNFYL